MPEFGWKARTSRGGIVTGRAEAAGAIELARMLSSKGLILTRAQPVAAKKHAFGGIKVSRKERILLTQNFADALGAGISLIETLDEFAKTYPRAPVRRMLESIRNTVEGGGQLSDGLADYPKVFPVHYVEAVRASERTGRISEVFEELAEELEWQDEIASKVTSTMAYPAILLVAVIGVACLFLFVLLPKFRPLFEAAGAELPLSTRILIGTSDFLVANWVIVLPAVPALIFLLKFLLQTGAGRDFVDRMKLSLPVLRVVTRHVVMARFSRSLATLANAGLGLGDALAVSGAAAGSRSFASKCLRAKDHVLSGKSLAESLAGIDLFSALDLRMIRVGEKSGRLVNAFSSLARLHDRVGKRQLHAAVTVVEPLLIVMMAAIVIFLALSIFMPIYGALDNVGT